MSECYLTTDHNPSRDVVEGSRVVHRERPTDPSGLVMFIKDGQAYVIWSSNAHGLKESACLVPLDQLEVAR